MIDQLQIGEKYSYDDFSASIAERKLPPPKKKKIKDTVPFSNETYDFSAINGEIYWEERELEYAFEIWANNPEELEELKTSFSNWVMGVMREKIYDPFIFGYYFIGTYDDMTFDDDEGLEKTTATVKFTAYPYKLSDFALKEEIPAETSHTYDIYNNGRRTTLSLEIEYSMLGGNNPTVDINDTTYEYTSTRAGSTLDKVVYEFVLPLYTGANAVKVNNNCLGASIAMLAYREEVL